MGARNWFSLDNSDTDLGGVSAMLIDVPGATPSQLALALGKDGNAYLLNRNNLGGIAAPIAQLSLDGVIRGQSSATYRTSQSTYFVFRASNQIKAYKITATSPPTIVTAWAVTQNGQGSPWVTTTDGTNNAIVWVVGAQGDGQLHGYNKVYAFRVPGGTPTPSPTASPTPTATATATATPTATAAPISTPTATATASPTATPRPTPSPRPRATPRPRPTPPPRPTL